MVTEPRRHASLANCRSLRALLPCCRLILLAKTMPCFGDRRGFGVRVRSGLVVVALIVIGSIGNAAAQGYYPPPPPGYYPPPPGYYPPPPGYYPPPPGDYYPPPPADYYPPPPPFYARPPVPPSDVGASAPEPSYNSAYQQGGQVPPPYPPPPYPPGTRPYYGPTEPAAAQPMSPDVPRPPGSISGGGDVTGSIHAPAGSPPDRAAAVAGLPPEYQPEGGPATDLPQQFHRQLVDYVTPEPAGTIIIDTPHTYLYLMLVPARPCATASVSGAKDLPGPAPSASATGVNGRTGIRRKR